MRNRTWKDTVGVVLAGGLGSRLRGVLGTTPKLMALVDGRPFIDWVIEYLGTNGIVRIIVSTGFGADVIEGHLRASAPTGITVDFAREASALGTAGGLAHAAESVTNRPDYWLVCNGDTLALAPLALLAGAAKDPQVAGAILGVRMADAGRYGTVVGDHAGFLSRFAEKQSGRGTINAGVYLLRDQLIRNLPATRPLSLEREVFPQIVAQGGRIRIVEADSPFIDIGTPESLAAATDFVRIHRDLIASGGMPGTRTGSSVSSLRPFPP